MTQVSHNYEIMELKDADVEVLIVQFTVVVYYFWYLGMTNMYSHNFHNLNLKWPSDIVEIRDVAKQQQQQETKC